MARLVVDAVAQVVLQLLREPGNVPQRRTQVVRYRVTERFQLTVDVGDLRNLAFELAIEFVYLLFDQSPAR